jgi:hypothetical protein
MSESEAEPAPAAPAAPAHAPAPALDPALLERLRRGVPLSLGERGTWAFDGEPVTHPGVARALTDGLDLSDGGEPIVALGAQWCYVTIVDTPLRVLAVDGDAAGLWLRLDDGRRVALDASTLVEDDGRGLRATVPSRAHGRPLAARFTNRAQADLAPLLGWDDARDRPLLRQGGVEHLIPRSGPP